MISPNSTDIIFISFDEPNADQNFLNLKRKFPHVKRVHGVLGFDKSHQEAARIAETECFCIIDGDNKVTQDFSKLTLSEYNSNYVYSWASKNVINGLIYGNGGIKLWNKKHFVDLNCHEKGIVDWCFKIPYYQMNDWFSYCECNTSPLQAFRAGFREGVKLGLDSSGNRIVNLIKTIDHLPPSTTRRLLAWLTIGSDVINGMYCIYGARLGFLKVTCEDHFDVSLISDYAWFEQIWNNEFKSVKEGNFLTHYEQMADDICRIFNLPVSNLDSLQSELVKKLIYNPRREGAMIAQVSLDKTHINKSFDEKLT